MTSDYKFLKIADCSPVNSTYPLRTRELQIEYLKEKFTINGKFEVLQVLPINVEMEISLTSCDIEGRKCNKLPTVSYPRICEKMKIPTSFSYEMFQGIQPTPHCPIQIGTYEMINKTLVRLEILKHILWDEALFKVQTIGYEKRGLKKIRPLTCLRFEIQIIKRKLKM